MAAAAGLPEEPAAKRVRLILGKLEDRAYAQMSARGSALHVDPQEPASRESLTKVTENLIDRFNAEVAGWPAQPEDSARRALLVMGLLLHEPLTWPSSSDLLIARILKTIFWEEFRAHFDGVYHYNAAGAWVRVEEVGEAELREMERSLCIFGSLLLRVFEANTARSWPAVFQNLSAGVADLGNFVPVDLSDFTVNPQGPPRAAWARELFKSLSHVSVRFTASRRSKQVMDDFGTWFQEPNTAAAGFLAFDDSSWKINDEAPSDQRFTQVPHSPLNNCYMKIGVPLGAVALDEDVLRLRRFFATIFAGKPMARFIDAAYEARAVSQLPTPQKMVVYRGRGLDGKSARTLLRSNVFGGKHMCLSPTTLQTPEEFRIQGGSFAFAALVTVQECQPGAPLMEDIWKKWISGEKIATRPLYGLSTVYHRWNLCGKFWEVNEAFPSIHGDVSNWTSLYSFSRRMLVLEMDACFEAADSKVDIENKVFEDPDFEDAGEVAHTVGAQHSVRFTTAFFPVESVD